MKMSKELSVIADISGQTTEPLNSLLAYRDLARVAEKELLAIHIHALHQVVDLQVKMILSSIYTL